MTHHIARLFVSVLPVLWLTGCLDQTSPSDTSSKTPPHASTPATQDIPSEGILAGDIAKQFWNKGNCKASVWTDASGNPVTVDQKFGDGSAAVTRCLAETEEIKVVYQVNAFCDDAACTKPYALGNVLNQIADYEVTHAIAPDQYEIVLVVHSGGWKFVLDPAKGHANAADNVFAAKIVDLVKRPNVKVLFCQNTASSNKVQLSHMIDGVGFVTSGVSAIADLQEVGYQYIQP